MKIQQEKVNQALKAVYKGITKDITSSKHIIICYMSDKFYTSDKKTMKYNIKIWYQWKCRPFSA